MPRRYYGAAQIANWKPQKETREEVPPPKLPEIDMRAKLEKLKEKFNVSVQTND